jgi:hypothetical protein
VTTSVLLSDGELLHALAGKHGVPNNRQHPDPRLEPLAVAGLIALYGDRWRWRVRIPSQLTREQREYIADDQRCVRLEDR